MRRTPKGIEEVEVTTDSTTVYLIGRIRQWLDKPYNILAPRSAFLGIGLVWTASFAPWLWLYLIIAGLGVYLVMREPSWSGHSGPNKVKAVFVTAIAISLIIAVSSLASPGSP